MKRLVFTLLILLVTSFSYAECPFTFSCTPQGCSKVTDLSCTIPAARLGDRTQSGLTNNSNPATFFTPQNGSAGNSNYTSNELNNSSSKKNITPSYDCAENGSCYGDISSVNGTPKTIQVDGYYRKDGTYVRGHYRSSGR